MEITENNTIILAGKIESINFYYECNNKRFNDVVIGVQRFSLEKDYIHCNIQEDFCKGYKVGDYVEIAGAIRSRNYKDDKGKNRCKIYVQAETLCEYNGTDINKVEFIGTLCRQPIFRTTPKGKSISDFIVANNKNRISSYIPSIAWGANAYRIKDMKVGTRLEIIGRLQSREYNKKINENEFETRTAYELSVNTISLL